MTRSFSEHMRQEARRLVTRDVDHLVTAVHGGSAMADTRTPGDLFSRLRPVDPLHGVLAARTIRYQAEKLMHEFVTEARARGVSWLKIAPALHFDGTDDEQLMAAFNWAAINTAFYFKCLCGEQIRDTGPENGRPTNAESGHLDGCESLAAHVAAFDAYEEALIDEANDEALRNHNVVHIHGGQA